MKIDLLSSPLMTEDGFNQAFAVRDTICCIFEHLSYVEVMGCRFLNKSWRMTVSYYCELLLKARVSSQGAKGMSAIEMYSRYMYGDAMLRNDMKYDKQELMTKMPRRCSECKIVEMLSSVCRSLNKQTKSCDKKMVCAKCSEKIIAALGIPGGSYCCMISCACASVHEYTSGKLAACGTCGNMLCPKCEKRGASKAHVCYGGNGSESSSSHCLKCASEMSTIRVVEKYMVKGSDLSKMEIECTMCRRCEEKMVCGKCKTLLPKNTKESVGEKCNCCNLAYCEACIKGISGLSVAALLRSNTTGRGFGVSNGARDDEVIIGRNLCAGK